MEVLPETFGMHSATLDVYALIDLYDILYISITFVILA
jgi:hypothetical protein